MCKLLLVETMNAVPLSRLLIQDAAREHIAALKQDSNASTAANMILPLVPVILGVDDDSIALKTLDAILPTMPESLTAVWHTLTASTHPSTPLVAAVRRGFYMSAAILLCYDADANERVSKLAIYCTITLYYHLY